MWFLASYPLTHFPENSHSGEGWTLHTLIFQLSKKLNDPHGNKVWRLLTSEPDSQPEVQPITLTKEGKPEASWRESSGSSVWVHALRERNELQAFVLDLHVYYERPSYLSPKYTMLPYNFKLPKSSICT